MPTFYIIDGNAYMHRAYHALPPLTTSKGVMVNALYGFVKMMVKVLKAKKPDYVVICFDFPAPSFRHTQYGLYKANRKKIDDELKNQMPMAREAAVALNMAHIEKEGFEADDIIATLAKQAANDGAEVFIVTSDKDALQLVGGNIKVWNEAKDIVYGVEEVREKYGLTPDRLVDMFSMMGDASDNVPGIGGIGEKTAVKLIQRFGSLDDIFKNLDLIEGRTKVLIQQGIDAAKLSRSLVELKGNVNLGFNWSDCKVKPINEAEITDFAKKYEFISLINDVLPRGAKETSALNFEVQVKTIYDEAELRELALEALKRKMISIDTETTGLDPLTSDLVGISLAFEEDHAYYLPLGHKYEGVTRQVELSKAVEILKPVLESTSVRKYGQNLKYDLLVLKHNGIEMKGLYIDTMIASYCLNPSKNSHGLKPMIFEMFGLRMTTIDELIGKGAKQITMAEVEIEKAAPYAGADAAAVIKAAKIFQENIKDKKLEGLFYDIEMPIVETLALMEWHGIKVDLAFVTRLSERYTDEMKIMEKKLFDIAGEEFNPNSPKQLAVILFDKLKLPVIKKTKTGYGTDEEVLNQLSGMNELPARILEYRELQKLKSTYLDALIEMADKVTSRVHTSFNQAVTATGRLSSSAPNLQNIPVRSEQGKLIRKCFIAEKGCSLLSADYSQIDLRALAHISNDEALRKAFYEGRDIHTATAGEVFGVEESAVTPEMRRIAKTINFGIVYGMSAFSLAQQLRISNAEAKKYMDNYFVRYKGVKNWMEEVVKTAREKGYVSTVTGRIRYLPDINSKNFQVRGFSERMALNTPVQGTSADIIKMAMNDIGKMISTTGAKAKMLLQVHDELLFEIPDKEVDEFAFEVKNKMENALKLEVPIVVALKTGKDWDSLENMAVK